MKRPYVPVNNVYLSEEQLEYAIKAVYLMAPLVHKPEATLQRKVLNELRRALESIKLVK